jgi:prepilin-type processing-associated H-X9-DG protein
LIMPDEYFCPADKVARYDQLSAHDVLVSYSYNVSDWNNATTAPDYSRNLEGYWAYTNGLPPVALHKWLIGHKRTAIPRASEKIVFTDSSDWWCTWDGADYVQGWDVVGHGSWTEYAAVGIYGPVLYRHNEGANVCFYDGHVDHMAKEKVYIDKASGGDPPDDDGTGMWFVIPTWP